MELVWGILVVVVPNFDSVVLCMAGDRGDSCATESRAGGKGEETGGEEQQAATGAGCE